MASFYREVFGALSTLGAEVHLGKHYPFDLPDADRAFADGVEHTSYDPAWANRYWQVLSQVGMVLEEFASVTRARSARCPTPGTPSIWR